MAAGDRHELELRPKRCFKANPAPRFLNTGPNDAGDLAPVPGKLAALVLDTSTTPLCLVCLNRAAVKRKVVLFGKN